MASTRITPTDYTDRAALWLDAGQTARSREDHTRRRFLVCRTDTRTIGQHSTSAAALAELERLQQSRPTNHRRALKIYTGRAAQKKGQPCKASPKQNDQAPITAPHQDSTPAVQEVKP